MLHPYTDLDSMVAVEGAEPDAAPALLVAGGAGDGVLATGRAVDVLGFGSGVLVLAGAATLGAAESLSLSTLTLQTSDDATFATGVTSVDLIGGTSGVAAQAIASSVAGGSEAYSYKVGLELDNRDRYVRVTYTPDFSAGATDTASLAVLMVKGGPRDTRLTPESTVRAYA